MTENVVRGGVKTLSQDDVEAAVLAALDEINRPGERVVSKWSSGKSWYRKWSDGWIEQGGFLKFNTEEVTCSFHVSFSNTNYTVLLGFAWNGANYEKYPPHEIWTMRTKSSTGLQCAYMFEDTMHTNWYAAGY